MGLQTRRANPGALGAGPVPNQIGAAFSICGLRLRYCTRPTSTGLKTEQTWPQPVSVLTPGTGWRKRWDQLGYRTWADLARTSAGHTPKET